MSRKLIADFAWLDRTVDFDEGRTVLERECDPLSEENQHFTPSLSIARNIRREAGVNDWKLEKAVDTVYDG